MDHGTQLRLPGRGAAGPRGGPNGDLFVHVRVRPHQRFVRDGVDLIHDLEITMTQATLGAHLKYETLDGEEDLLIPAGTQTGKVFTLPGRGVHPLQGRGRGRGNLHVRILVATPTHLTKQQEELLRAFAESRGEDVAPPDRSLLGRIRSAFKSG